MRQPQPKQTIIQAFCPYCRAVEEAIGGGLIRAPYRDAWKVTCQKCNGRYAIDLNTRRLRPGKAWKAAEDKVRAESRVVHYAPGERQHTWWSAKPYPEHVNATPCGAANKHGFSTMLDNVTCTRCLELAQPPVQP